MRSEFETDRLLTLLDMAAITPAPGATLGADVGPIEGEQKAGPALAADIGPIEPGSPTVAADGPHESPAVAADGPTKLPSVAADHEPIVRSVGADIGPGQDMGS